MINFLIALWGLDWIITGQMSGCLDVCVLQAVVKILYQ